MLCNRVKPLLFQVFIKKRACGAAQVTGDAVFTVEHDILLGMTLVQDELRSALTADIFNLFVQGKGLLIGKDCVCHSVQKQNRRDAP